MAPSPVNPVMVYVYDVSFTCTKLSVEATVILAESFNVMLDSCIVLSSRSSLKANVKVTELSVVPSANDPVVVELRVMVISGRS